MTFSESIIENREGRTIEVATFGDPSGPTVFFHHGTPGSILTATTFASIADDAGLFFVTTSRAGYGNSMRREGRSVASVVDDVRTVLDALGRASYLSVGWSGGGPHALACGALDAPRCRAVWSLAGVVPFDADFDWTAGMGPENLEEFALSQQGGPEYEAHIAKAADEFLHGTEDNIIEIFGGLLSDVDKAALASAAARRELADACRHGFARGYFGFMDDDQAFLSPWGFDVADIDVPVTVWYGDQDLMVPPTHGAWLSEHLRDATIEHHPEEGHISIVSEHLTELAASFVRAR